MEVAGRSSPDAAATAFSAKERVLKKGELAFARQTGQVRHKLCHDAFISGLMLQVAVSAVPLLKQVASFADLSSWCHSVLSAPWCLISGEWGNGLWGLLQGTI